jgi:hypothetical protein
MLNHFLWLAHFCLYLVYFYVGSPYVVSSLLYKHLKQLTFLNGESSTCRKRWCPHPIFIFLQNLFASKRRCASVERRLGWPLQLCTCCCCFQWPIDPLNLTWNLASSIGCKGSAPQCIRRASCVHGRMACQKRIPPVHCLENKHKN